ncbi:MAG: hypothetical protein GDA52_10790 [Rhodobacteraceae bacterium]|nr:hypothetical protein [Paracoccaceae bacterium]
MNRTITAATLAAIFLTTGTAAAQAQQHCNWKELNFWEEVAAEDVENCIAAGANVNARNEDGVTPLHGAAVFGKAEAVHALLAAGANIAARTEDGQTPADFVEENEALRNHPVFWDLHDGRFD